MRAKGKGSTHLNVQLVVILCCFTISGGVKNQFHSTLALNDQFILLGLTTDRLLSNANLKPEGRHKNLEVDIWSQGPHRCRFSDICKT